jgi:glycosyltransferase involved in cell wall biosynthesis
VAYGLDDDAVSVDTALSIDPDNVPAMAEAIISVLTNPALSADLQARALRRATSFTWQKTAEETLAIYEELYAKSYSSRKKA